MRRSVVVPAVVVAAWVCASSPARAESEGVLVEGGRVLTGGTEMRRPAPRDDWTVSLSVRLTRGSAVDLRGRGWSIALTRHESGRTTLRVGTRSSRLERRRGWPGAGRHHLELAASPPAALAVDGRRLRAPVVSGGQIRLLVRGRRVRLHSLIVAPVTRMEALLLHRLASLHIRTQTGRFPLGADAADRLHFDSGWTSGFWPGALWHAASLAPGDGVFARWALESTLARLGAERADTHDLGFIYGHSSVRAHERLCRAPVPPTRESLCRRLRRSALRAAERLVELAGTNRVAGLIPMSSRGRHADVIIDSAMNLALLAWATRITGRPGYAALARSHAHGIAEHLVRSNGSTTQSVHFRRRDGAVVRRHTHQGLDARSTWARGQSWAVYGFAEIGEALHDPELVRVSERAAQFVATRLPAGRLPRWDYDAPFGAPRDVSAGVIGAAGLFKLAAACQGMPTACVEADRWRPFADHLLAASLEHMRTRPPLGRLGSQVYTLGGRTSWDDRAELMFGLDYALEAIALRQSLQEAPATQSPATPQRRKLSTRAMAVWGVRAD
jgi:unsaturated chondroitin disaccharide hydrolase